MQDACGREERCGVCVRVPKKDLQPRAMTWSRFVQACKWHGRASRSAHFNFFRNKTAAQQLKSMYFSGRQALSE